MPKRAEREREFIDALRPAETPDHAATRVVYADWLEEHGDLARAAYLRIAAKRKPTQADRRRRAELAAAMSSEWRRAVSPPLGRADVETLTLEQVLARIATSDHPASKVIGKAVQDWVEALGAEDDEDNPYGQVRLYDGDLVIPKGNLETGPSAVVVLGDLVIENQFTDMVEADQSFIGVAGNTQCRSVWQLGDGLFAGDLRCNILYGSSYHSNRTEVLGDAIVTEAVIEHDHHIVIHGSLSTTARIGRKISVAGRRVEDSGDLDALDPALRDDDGWDEARLYRRICEGRSILRAELRDRLSSPSAPARRIRSRARTKRKR